MPIRRNRRTTPKRPARRPKRGPVKNRARGTNNNIPAEIINTPKRQRVNRRQRPANVARRRQSPNGRRTVRNRPTGIRNLIRPTVARYYLPCGKPYNGNTIEVNGIHYTTDNSGVLLGSSKPLTRKK